MKKNSAIAAAVVLLVIASASAFYLHNNEQLFPFSKKKIKEKKHFDYFIYIKVISI